MSYSKQVNNLINTNDRNNRIKQVANIFVSLILRTPAGIDKEDIDITIVSCGGTPTPEDYEELYDRYRENQIRYITKDNYNWYSKEGSFKELIYKIAREDIIEERNLLYNNYKNNRPKKKITKKEIIQEIRGIQIKAGIDISKLCDKRLFTENSMKKIIEYRDRIKEEYELNILKQ